jgi:hypothetical protein
MVVDLFMVYQFIRKLVKPFDEWEAYKLGIIDEDGNVLIKRKNFSKGAQTNAFGVFDLMILNLKKLLAKVPGGSSKLASYGAALFLIREWNHFTDDTLLIESVTDAEIEESICMFVSRYDHYNRFGANVNHLSEEPVINNVGGGKIAGIGVGPDGEPPMKTKRKKKTLNDLLRRRNVTGK